MACEADETTIEKCDAATAVPVPRQKAVQPASAARESLSWIRALASQWEDDLPGSSPDGDDPNPQRQP